MPFNSGVLASTASPPSTAAITGASTQILPANPNRKGLVLVNVGANNVSLAWGANPAIVNGGITLTPNGVMEMDHYTRCVLSLNAIASGGSTLAIQEYN